MNKILQILLLLGVALPIVSHASDICRQEYGEMVCKKGIVKTIDATGFVKMNGTQVENHTQINGSLRALNIVLKSLTVNGEATIKNSVVNDEAVINGNLTAKNSKFLSGLTLISHHAIFDTCELQDLVFKKTNPTTHVLKLFNTVVGGNVKFEDGNGVIYLCKGSKVIGSVAGGKIIEICKK